MPDESGGHALQPTRGSPDTDRSADIPGGKRHDGQVNHVTGLVTFIEVDNAGTDPRQMSVSARHEAVLTNGARVLLLADRGWTSSGPADIWTVTSVEDIADTARVVVGPDEPFGGRSHKDMEADHWASLAAVLRHQGIDMDALELGRLHHDVVLGEQLLARLGNQPRDDDPS